MTPLSPVLSCPAALLLGKRQPGPEGASSLSGSGRVWGPQWRLQTADPFLMLWHKGNFSSCSPLAQVPPESFHRLRKKRAKGNPDLSPKLQNLDLGGTFRAPRR